MFTRKPGDRPLPVPRQASHPPQLPVARQALRASNVRSVIGPDLCVLGNLESPGEVQIDGEVQGDVLAGRIVVGVQGHITGTLVADEIVIGGNVQGSVRGNRVTFQSGSRIEGDVAHRSLSIEQGAYFEGKSRRVENPTATQ
jgi:cytoskeletal protein CcmA (bactofilin family)